MKKKITDSEMQIMDYLWTRPEGAKLTEITHYCGEIMGKTQKQQSIRVYLLRLNKKGHIKISYDEKTNKTLYAAVQSKEEYLQEESQSIVEKLFNGSIFDFVTAFSGGVTITKEEAEKLREYLKQYDD